MTDKQIEALTFARKVLNDCHHYINDAFAAYTALEAALAEQAAQQPAKQPAKQQQQQEPVAWRAWFDADNGARWLFSLWPEEERLDVEWQPLYTSPQPSKPWVGLTEQERNDLEDYCEMIIGKAAFEAIEAKLREKNAQPSKPLTDERESFKQYVEQCDQCAIVPDVGGAFHAGWLAAHGITGETK